MQGRIRKLIAMLLITVLVVQQGRTVVTAVENMSETSTEAMTQPPAETQPPQTEPATQAPATEAPQTEPATQAPTEPPQTEPVTQAPTEPPQTEPATQAPTETEQTEPVTQAPTEPPQTEPVTQAPTETEQTEPATQAPTETEQTEPVTQAPTETEQTEPATQKPAETEEERPDESDSPAPPVPEFPTESESETETEAQTEVKDRQNDGTRIRLSVVKDGLIDALPYLIVANQVTGLESGEAEEAEPESGTGMENGFSEAAPGSEDTGDAAEGMTADILSGADAADILGMLESFSIELANGRGTRTVKVVNLYVSEDGEIDDQKLQEALAVKLPNVEDELVVVNVVASSANQSLSFSGYDIYDAEKVLYNFSAFEYVNENKIKFIDYTGTVTLSSGAGLTGTWLAPMASVNVTSGLCGAVYANTVNVSAGVSLEKAVLAEGAEETELSGETQTESETEENGRESETEFLTEEDTEEETEFLTEEDTEEETEEETELDLIDENEALQADLVSNVDLTIHVRNGSAAENNTSVAGIRMSLKAAEDITSSTGEVVHKKDAPVWTFESTAEGEAVGSHLTNSGSYYVEMEADAPQTEYLPGARVYFRISRQGNVLVGQSQEQHVTNLNYFVYQLSDGESLPKGMLVVEAPSETTFVIKDADKNVITDAAGRPVYFMVIPGTSTGRAAVTLPEGTYWLSQLTAKNGYLPAQDQEIVIAAEDTEGKLVQIINSRANVQNANTLHLTAQTSYKTTLLTAEKDMEFFAALFSDEELTQRITGVQKLTQTSGSTASASATLHVPGRGPFYLAETDELGVPVTGTDYRGVVEDTSGKALSSIAYTAESGGNQTAVLHRKYTSVYPDNLFSYEATVSVTKNVQDKIGNAQAVTDEFYISLFKDTAHKMLVETLPVIALNNASTGTVTTGEVKVTSAETVYFAAETNADGTPVETLGNGTYTYDKSTYGEENANGRLTVTYGKEAKLTLTNILGSSVIRIRVVDSAGRHLPGAKFAIKNADGNPLSFSKTSIFESKSEDTIINIPQEKGSYMAGVYYLSEIKAPAGYMPVPDVQFNVVPGLTTDAVLVNSVARGSGKVTVGVQVYAGSDQLYAQDTSSGQYAAAGTYTRYIALFLDSAHTQKATNVQSVTISGFTGTTTFENLEEGRTYYVAETDQYGRVRTSNETRTISYADGGRVTAASANAQAVASENYAALPDGFRYSARLTIEKQVVDSSNAAKAVSESFYVGIYRNSDYSDTPTVVRLDLNNAASASVTRRILLSGSSDVTYYFAEVDANGKRVESSADFKYTPSIDKTQVTLTKSADEKVVVTNKDRISKVTLYLTKRVYRGSTLQNVNATFYAGLFRDPQFTTLYADPVPLNIQNNNSVTLKLSLNLGSASEATIYVAEVDANGRVVQSGSSFGYDTRVINSTAHFTQETTEVQSIILNTIAGTATEDDWNDIYSSGENNVGGGGSYSDYISENGSASSGTASSGSDTTGTGSSSVQTGDETPWAEYLALMLVSGTAFLMGGRRRRRARK